MLKQKYIVEHQIKHWIKGELSRIRKTQAKYSSYHCQTYRLCVEEYVNQKFIK